MRSGTGTSSRRRAAASRWARAWRSGRPEAPVLPPSQARRDGHGRYRAPGGAWRGLSSPPRPFPSLPRVDPARPRSSWLRRRVASWNTVRGASRPHEQSRRAAIGRRRGSRARDRRHGMATKVSTKIFPHLWYAEGAEEAARFYASIFPDSRVDRVTTLLSETPSGPPGSVKVVDFTLL